MSRTSPFKKQISQNDSGTSRKRNFKFIFLSSVLFHVVVFCILLIQGCNPKLSVTKLDQIETAGMPGMTKTGQGLDSDTLPLGFDSDTVAPVVDENSKVSQLGNTPVEFIGLSAAGKESVTSPVSSGFSDFLPEITDDDTVIPRSRKLEELPTSTEYQIRSGDTIVNLAKKNGIGVQDILKMNPGIDPRRLKIGKVITLPSVKAAQMNRLGDGESGEKNTDRGSDTGKTYTVQKGDSLSKIARKFGISYKTIMKENNLKNTRIQPNQVLVIPVD